MAWRLAAVLLAGLLASACNPNAPVRTEAAPCAAGACAAGMIEHHGAGEAPFTLAFVEFDDQGREFDLRQGRALFDHMAETAKAMPLAIVTFVHGWKHGPGTEDTNVRDFRTLLGKVAAFEAGQPAARRRAVVGVYAGWRGKTLRVPWVENLTFWGRKDAAQRVADGSLRSLLGGLRTFRDLANQRDDPDGTAPWRQTRMVTIGHSFGGLAVYSAVAQFFVDRAAESLIRARHFGGLPAPDSRRKDPREVPGYGDLVVIVNPAYEAMRYEPVRRLLDRRQVGALPERFMPRQSPVLVQITSVGETAFGGDTATGMAFPAGRWLNTFAQATRTDPASGEDERAQVERSVGHYAPFWTHELRRGAAPPEPATTAAGRDPATVLPYDRDAACRSFQAFKRPADGRLEPGWTRTYRSGATLTEIGGDRYDPASPFWVVRAHPDIVLDHNDITAPIFVDFLAQLYGDIDRLKYPASCKPAPQE